MTEVAKDPPFVAIGIPSMDFVDTEFMMSFSIMLANFRGITAVVNSQGCYVDEGRMSCVDGAKTKTMKAPDGRIRKATHLLFLDSDMQFPPDTLTRLLAHDKDVVGCVYSRRVAPFTNIGIAKDKTLTNVRDDSGLVEMDLLPTGCLLIKMSVFDTLPEYDDDGPVFGYKWLPEVKKYEREDVRFCRMCREHGIQIWCDPKLSAQIGHVGKAVYTVDQASKERFQDIGMEVHRDSTVARTDAPMSPVQTQVAAE